MAHHSRTDYCIGEFVVWSALAVYSAAWVASLAMGLGGYWLLASGTAAAYVGMHVFEITRRGHCYLSADSTAVPVSLVLFSLAVIGLWSAGELPLPGRPLVLAWGAYCLALMAGHVLALAYSIAVGSALTLAFRGRIASEEAVSAEPAGVRDTGR